MKKISCPFKKGRPIDETLHDRILDVAVRLFMLRGFRATSMDDIAREAGMSKLTLYRRFKDKSALFTAVIERKCHEFIPDEMFDIPDHETARESLLRIGNAFFQLLLTEDAISMERMMAAEAAENPVLTNLFYESGPKRIKSLMADTLKRLAQTGKIKLDDPERERALFLSLFKGSDIHMRAVLNIGKKPSKKDIDDYAQSAVDLFLRR
jgi:TetR/AcrR family transcriptional repressor of mexJK operon